MYSASVTVPGTTGWAFFLLALIGMLLVACSQPEVTSIPPPSTTVAQLEAAATPVPDAVTAQAPTTTPTSAPALASAATPTPASTPSPSTTAIPTAAPKLTPTPTRTPTPAPEKAPASTPTATPEIIVCIPSGNDVSIQSALTREGSEAVLYPNAVFELSEAIFFTQDNQHIYTQGFPTDDSRALLRVVGEDLATAVSAEGNDYVSIKNVIIDGNRPALGIADGALINFGRGILDRDALGHVVEWVRAYEPRGWTIIYLGGPCDGAVARNNDLGPAGRAEYAFADGISVDCKNAVVENNTITDATDGGIVIFQSPGALIANNVIRTENRIMFYGISMEDYWPYAGDFTNTRVTGNIIDASGAMIRRGIGMGPLVGCVDVEENPLRSRGAIVTGNTLMGDHMAYGFVVGGVEDWTVTGNVDLSTHLVPEVVGDCAGEVVDPPSGFQLNPGTAEGTFQEEFELAVLGFSVNMWPFQILASESCLADLIGVELLDDIRTGNRGELWPALEDAPNGELIARCLDIYQSPDISDMPGNVGLEVLSCTPGCIELRIFNLSETDTADMQAAEFILDDFSVPCIGLPAALGPQEETSCTITDGMTDGFHVLNWYGVPGGGGKWVSSYPFD